MRAAPRLRRFARPVGENLNYVLPTYTMGVENTVVVNKAAGKRQRREPERYVCEQCGKSFEAKLTPAHSDRRYCGCECFARARSRRIERTCEFCEKIFEVTPFLVENGHGRYWSRGCADKARMNRIAFTCQQCGKQVDFVLPQRMAVIECDGKYWHSFLDVLARDRRKDEYLRKLGYQVFRFSDREIQNSPTQCVNQVLAAAPVISSMSE